jgi:hypothetical protein
MSEDPEVLRLLQGEEAARARQIAEIEAAIARQTAQMQQEIEAESLRRKLELEAAERVAREAVDAAAAARPGHLASWQQEEVERQLRLARQAAQEALNDQSV